MLPIPQVQIFGGGAHTANKISIQDFLIIPNGAKNFYEAMEWIFKIYRKTYDKLKAKNLLMGVADEGGFWPCFNVGFGVVLLLVLALFCCWFWRFLWWFWTCFNVCFGIVLLLILALFCVLLITFIAQPSKTES